MERLRLSKEKGLEVAEGRPRFPRSEAIGESCGLCSVGSAVGVEAGGSSSAGLRREVVNWRAEDCCSRFEYCARRSD